MSPTLDEATTEQLVEELYKRYEGLLVVLCGERIDDSEIEKTRLYWQGGTHLATGLAAYATKALLDHEPI